MISEEGGSDRKVISRALTGVGEANHNEAATAHTKAIAIATLETFL